MELPRNIPAIREKIYNIDRVLEMFNLMTVYIEELTPRLIEAKISLESLTKPDYITDYDHDLYLLN